MEDDLKKIIVNGRPKNLLKVRRPQKKYVSRRRPQFIFVIQDNFKFFKWKMISYLFG